MLHTEADLFQSFATGMWGYGRHGDGHDLQTAVFPSRKAALKAMTLENQAEELTAAAIKRGEDPQYTRGRAGIAMRVRDLRDRRADFGIR